MKKEDLRAGMVVEKRDGSKHLLAKFLFNSINTAELIDISDGAILAELKDYNDDLTRKTYYKPFSSLPCGRELDIVKVYKDYTLKEVLWERKETPKLRVPEQNILCYLPDDAKYITRDDCGDLEVHSNKPERNVITWWCNGEVCYDLSAFNHLFQFIKWEDEPYKISELLEANK